MSIDRKTVTKEMNAMRVELSPDQIRLSDEKARNIWNSNACTREMAMFIAYRLLSFD
jgi:hypothetical protein